MMNIPNLLRVHELPTLLQVEVEVPDLLRVHELPTLLQVGLH